MVDEIIKAVEGMLADARKAYDEARAAKGEDLDAIVRKCVATRERAEALYDVLILIGNLELKRLKQGG